MVDAYMAWSHDAACGKTQDAGLLDDLNGHSLHVIDLLGTCIIIFLLLPIYLNLIASRDIIIGVGLTDKYLCSAFVRRGIIPSVPIKLTLGFSIQVLEFFHVAHLHCPQLSQQAFIKTLSDLQTVSRIPSMFIKFHAMLMMRFRYNIKNT